MKSSHEVLVSVITYSTTDSVPLDTVLMELKKVISISKNSPIYSVTGRPQTLDSVHDIRSHESFQGLSLCLRGEAELTPQELLFEFEKIIQNSPERIKNEIKIILLVYEDKTLISPLLTLPFPDFHRRPELIVPASELWGEYTHPILETTLSRLSKNFQLESWGDFFSQKELT